VIPANVFGGAGGSGQYDVVGLGVTTQQTLDFNNGKTYFGMWWSAGDVNNKLQFYDVGNNLLGSYVIGDIIPFLSPAYFGNPNSGGNAGEPYVYLNFTTTGGDLIDKVVFTNLNVAGFETDNHAVFDQPITPPGNAIPEPTAAFFGLALASVSALHRRRR
jgi:hypothetical protein